VPPEGSAGEDTRVWVGRVSSGHQAEHQQFVDWLNGPEAAEIFRRRRLTEYQLTEDGSDIQVVFKAPHTGDPRIMIDFLRYPGLWPEYWEFLRGGRGDEAASPQLPNGVVRVHWRRDR
jgi:hypothetical protein